MALLRDKLRVERDALRRLPGADPLARFLSAETAGGAVLLLAAALALALANSPWGGAYEALWRMELTLGAGPLALTEDLRHWISDGLMVLFFFVVGLEVKRELVVGELREPRAAAIPVIGAIGGALLPAVIFTAIVGGGEAAAGWAIPMATDIAFAVGVLALLGDRVPAAAKLFLLTIAIADDILAISVIALFYTDGLSVPALMVATAGLGGVVALRALGVTRVAAYVPVGLLIWLAVHESGVHATIAGVALGLLTPARPVAGRRVLEELESRLHPLTGFVVVPLFALANAGVAVGGSELAGAAANPLTWGIVTGLVLGKLAGIGGSVLLSVRLGGGSLPRGLDHQHVWGVAALGGIGFTVSLFITQLAYDAPALAESAKVGIFAGSLLSGLLGAVLLLRAGRGSQPRAVSDHSSAAAPRPPATSRRAPRESARGGPVM